MPRAPALIALLALSACTGATLAARRWIGEITPTTPGPACAKSTAVAQITDGRLIFTPDEGTWVLRGIAKPDGTLTAELTRPGADKQPFQTRLEATWTPETVTGTYKTPRCTFDVKLTRR